MPSPNNLGRPYGYCNNLVWAHNSSSRNIFAPYLYMLQPQSADMRAAMEATPQCCYSAIDYDASRGAI